MGLLDITEGNITLNGKKIDYNVTDNIGFLTEERSLLTKLTVKEQAIYFGALKGMKNEDILTRLDYLLDKFGITEYKNKKIKELSKGNQQKIQFITSILHEPKLLILDEPFAGLDPFNIELFKNEILELAEGNIKDIKENYQKKTILLKADINKKELESIKGVEEVIEKADEYEIKISSKDIINKVFQFVSKSKNVLKFVVEEPSLNEIFISKVGESYEK